MDPNLIHLDWGRVFEALVAIVVLAFLLERALALLFESNLFVNKIAGKSYKELIAFIVAGAVCWAWEFDAISMIFIKEKVTIYGAIITGAIVAGGSKASIKLFRDLLGFMSSAEAKRQAVLKKEREGSK